MMLRKKSSRWAGARALLLLPLMGIALGAFAETAYVFPEDKGTKEKPVIRIRGLKSSSDRQPLVLVNGREAVLDSIKTEQIESISVLKDSTATAVYGEKGKDGVILVTLKKDAENPEAVYLSVSKAKTVPGKSVSVTVVTTDSVGTAVTTGKPEEVRVVGYGVKPKNGTVVVNASGVTKSFRTGTEPAAKSQPAYVVDGVQVYEIESLDPNRIQSISVVKGDNIPQEYTGYNGVITITTKRTSDAQQAALKGGASGIEAARRGMEQARKYMSPDAWEEAQTALDKAQNELEQNRVRVAVQSAGYSESTRTEPASGENSVSVTTGRVTVRGPFPEGMLILINGKEASQADVYALKPGRIKKMTVYKGDEAVKKYGEKGRNGVADIRARR